MGSSRLATEEKYLKFSLPYGIVLIANFLACFVAIQFGWRLEESIQRIFWLNVLILIATPFLFKGEAMLFVLGTAVFPLVNLLVGLTVSNDEWDRLYAIGLSCIVNFIVIQMMSVLTNHNNFTYGLLWSWIPSLFLGFFTIGLWHN